MLIAQASSAQVKSFWLTIYDNGNWVNIGYPATIGTMFRMANIVTKLD